MVKLLINEVEIKFETTIFPDGTSQVWKLQDNIDFDPHADEPVILWLFENESELIHVCQLAQLVQAHLDTSDCTLRVPYLPYGRQDKEIDNKLSFALRTFKDILYSCNITRIETFDAHSNSEMVCDIPGISVKDFHKELIRKHEYNVICFPDKGAQTRYSNYGLNSIYCEKIRDQLTGNILGLKVIGANADMLFNKKVLIIDDICDGGMTFIKVAEALKPFEPQQIDLAVSHGIFSKGYKPILDSGITKIFTTNSFRGNANGYKVC